MKNFLEKNPIKISSEEFDDALADIAFVTGGSNTAKKLYAKIAEKRLGSAMVDGIPRHEINDAVKKMSQSEYEKRRENIQLDMGTAQPEGKIEVTWEVSETALNSDLKKERFIKRFGKKRFLEAMGIHEDMHILNDRGYHRALDRPYQPYKTTSGPGGSDTAGELNKPNPNVAGTDKE